MDFGDPPLRGEVRILPADRPGLEYLVDFDHDGTADESGPLGLGVILGYEFAESGPHPIRVTLRDGMGRLTVERTVIVNDTDALGLAAHRRQVVPGTFGGIAIDPGGGAAYASAPEADLLLALDPFRLTELWRLSLPIDDSRDHAGGVAISLDGGTVYVDVGDSLVRIDVSGPMPGAPERFARADTGEIVERLPDGDLLAGGGQGVLWIDSATGDVLRELDLESDLDFEADPEGSLVASASLRGIRAISVDDLAEVWEVPLFPLEYGALSFNTSGDLLFALVRDDEDWILLVVESATGRIERRFLLGSTDYYSTGDRITRPSARTTDGRFVVFATDVGALVVDASSGVPLIREVDGVLDQLTIGCCNVVPTEAFLLFASGDDGRLTQLRIHR